MRLTREETTTILAALRLLQEDLKNIPVSTRKRLHFNGHKPMSPREIDELCIRLNLGENAVPQLKDQPDLHRFEVQVIGCSEEQAAQVLHERLGHDEDYGFDYTLNW